MEYAGTLAILVGEEGRGIREILSHSHLTRLDFAVGSADLVLAGYLGHGGAIGLAQHRDHLFFAESTLSDGLLAGELEPFSQVMKWSKILGRSWQPRNVWLARR